MQEAVTVRNASSCIPRSILDTDLYKCTMQQAVLQHFPHVEATYRLILRDRSLRFSKEAVEIFRAAVSKFSDIHLTQEEYEWLKTKCSSLLSSQYIDYLKSYRFDPSQVITDFEQDRKDLELGIVKVHVKGLWSETMLWEVPLMATLSEVYFRTMDLNWNNEGQHKKAFDKGKELIENGCAVAEFGTRRRRSYDTQDTVVHALKQANDRNTEWLKKYGVTKIDGDGSIIGTSNVHLAMKYDMLPIGTVAHEWFMGIAALDQNYETANDRALTLWEEAFPNASLIALTDTFTSKPFFSVFLDKGKQHSHRWHGLRQDSGTPEEWTKRVKEVYEELGIDTKEKSIIYSDSLNVTTAAALRKVAMEHGFVKCSFGIGTFLTNDFTTADGTGKSKAMNMVIKLSSVNSRPCVKLSDDKGKATGDPTEVKKVRDVFGIAAEETPPLK